jgi:hypothetical protein
MIEKLKTLWSYFAIGLFVLGLIIILGVASSSNFNFYFFGFGVLLLIPGAISIIIETTDFGPKTKQTHLSDLKFTGIQIPVDLTKCKIIASNWTVTKPEKDNKTILFNELSNNSYENTLTVDVTLSCVRYSCVLNGKKRTFTSTALARDKLTLKLLLETKKETRIYIDRDDSRYYYFDVEFAEDNRG